MNDYANLYWSCVGCNSLKSSAWPSPSERRRGLRFADPCRELDYGFHWVENEEGYLIARTPCGQCHVHIIRLNRPTRVARRRERHELAVRLAEAMGLLEHLQAVPAPPSEREIIAHLKREVEWLHAGLSVAIPLIPPHGG